jgi:hypothetical protein
MPGTGPLRRSSAPARIKALVRKSRFRAAAQRSPRLSAIPWTAQNRYPCLGHTVTYVLASDPPEEPDCCSEVTGDPCSVALLGH